MVYQGRMQNGVVFREPVPLPNRAAVTVEPVTPSREDFWESCSLDELARRKGVSVSAAIGEMLGLARR